MLWSGYGQLTAQRVLAFVDNRAEEVGPLTTTARITVEDCLEKIPNHFAMIMASHPTGVPSRDFAKRGGKSSGGQAYCWPVTQSALAVRIHFPCAAKLAAVPTGESPVSGGTQMPL